MLEPLSNQPVAVRDHLGVDLLLNLTALSRLAPFMHDEHTLGTAARAAKVPASSLAYWVQRFLKAGLIEVTRVVPRAGKPIPYYRAVTSEFRVPWDAMPPGVRDEFLTRGRRGAFERFITASNQASALTSTSGLRISAHDDRGIELNVDERDNDANPSTEWWGSVSLTDDEAAEVRRLLDDVRTRFSRDRDDPGRTPYLMVLGFAPDPKK